MLSMGLGQVNEATKIYIRDSNVTLPRIVGDRIFNNFKTRNWHQPANGAIG